MSSTQLLHSLLLLLPLRCRRNCNKLISLALLLLSALFAYNEQRQQQTAAEAADDDGSSSSSSNSSSSSRGSGPAAATAATTTRTKPTVTLDTPLYTAVATAAAVVKRRSNKKAASSIQSRDVGTGTETGTGAAYISWHSSHCHRSPGAHTEAQAQAQAEQTVLRPATNKTRSALALTSLHKLKSSISPPSIDASISRLTIAKVAAAKTRTTNLLKGSCKEAATDAGETVGICCRNPPLPLIVAGSAIGSCHCIASIAT
ncbi:uncharacterized protein Dvir_GJ27033 [Drosophila virilis]|uniref:Uncharacterized protein n=1 Tax=Drosophila virilis TaxID=7244 RepID=A0A0Q9W4F3_DROVI|nr:uncharacterized protein Dvir_GJ27033 [Drosophila virilis]